MGSDQVSELIDKYYERDNSDANSFLKPGAFLWAPILEFEGDPLLAIVDRVDSKHERPATFQLRRRRKFKDDPFKHVPINEPGLQLESNEGLMVFKAKRRPVVLFSTAPEQWNLRSGKPADEVFLCVPAYRLEKYEPEHIAAIRCFKYVSLFHLPADTTVGRKESMLRFDRSQLVPKHLLERISPHQRLTDDALTLLQGWFRYWSTGDTEDWILEHQAEQVKRLKAPPPN